MMLSNVGDKLNNVRMKKHLVLLKFAPIFLIENSM